MDGLAAYIKSLGLKPGIWLAPHGQSNETVVRKIRAYFCSSRTAPRRHTWEGTYLVDPSTPESQKYLKDLFTKLSGWGYEYFKIDGQPIVVREYRNKKTFMKNPSDDADALYRDTLDSIPPASARIVIFWVVGLFRWKAWA